MRVIARLFAAVLLATALGTWVWSGFGALALAPAAMAQTGPLCSGCQPRGPCETAQCSMGLCTYTLISGPCPTGTNPCEAVCDGTSPHCQPNPNW
jgi:hypothetical protein